MKSPEPSTKTMNNTKQIRIFLASFLIVLVFASGWPTTNAEVRTQKRVEIRSAIGEIAVTSELKVALGTPVGIAAFKAAFIAAAQANFTAGERTRISNAFIQAYKSEWDARVRAGTADNAANRGEFVADKVVEFMRSTVQAEEYKAGLIAVPTPTPLPN